MKTALCSLVLLCSPLLTLADESSSVPGVLWESSSAYYGSDYPVWVSAESVFDSDQKPDSRYFDDRSREVIRLMTTTESGYLIDDECDSALESGTHPLAEEGILFPDLETAIQKARAIARFQLSEPRSGIAYGQSAGAMFRAVPKEIYKGALVFPEYYVFLPSGRFELAGRLMCTSDDQYPLPKNQSGGEAVLFLTDRIPPAGSTVIFPRRDGYVLLEDDDAVVASRWCPGCSIDERREVLSRDEFMRKLRDATNALSSRSPAMLTAPTRLFRIEQDLLVSADREGVVESGELTLAVLEQIAREESRY